MSDMGTAFIAALRSLERDRDIEPIVALHSDDCELGNLRLSTRFPSQDGARRFWTAYRDTFGEVESSFSLVVTDPNAVALEWSTQALVNGEAVVCSGVTVLELRDDRISRAFAYFDPTRLGVQVRKNDGVDARAPIEQDGWTEDPQEVG